MEYGKIRDGGLTAHYASGVELDSYEELIRFYDRVNQWANTSGLVIGEGMVLKQQNLVDSLWPLTYVLLAPVIEGDPESAFYFSPTQTAAI